MDKSQALHNLLNGTASEEEIGLLKQLLASGEISIGRDVNRSVVIIGSGNKVELTAEALGILNLEPVDEGVVQGEPPYMGLRYFDTSDTDLFFGREVLTSELFARVQKESFLAIVGASGSGKSSVARAGLIPLWQQENERGVIHVITPTARPLESLAVSLTHNSESVTATSTLMDDLMKDTRSLRLYTKKALGETKLLLLVDQFEETFTLCKDQAERKSFIENLLSLAEADGAARVVITLRADFYHHCAEYEGLRNALKTHQEYIGAMTTDELRQAITTPAEKNGWDFQPGLVDLILSDVGTEPGALPLLSHALLETWKRRRGRTLTLQGYHEAGGVKKAITQTAESVYDKFTPAEQTIARGIFLRLTELGEGVQDTRRRVKMDELGQAKEQETVTKVLKTLTDARLVTTEEDSAEVAHEALIREWGTLRKWLDEDRDSLRLHRHLTESAHEWERAGRDEAFLDHRGGRLDDALLLEDSSIYRFSEIEQAYLKECVAYQKREQNRREHLRRQIIYGLGVGFFVMLVIAITAGTQWQRAEKQTQIAFARQLAAQAKLLSPDSETMLIQRNLLSIESIQRYPNLESQQNLNDIFLFSPLVSARLNQPIYNTILSPDKKSFAVIGYNEPIRLWDISTGQETARLSYVGSISSVTFSPDGRLLAIVSGRDNFVYLWDLSTNQEKARLAHIESSYYYSYSVTFSPDGKLLATTERNIIHLWDVSTGWEKARFSYSGYNSVTFSPDGKLFVIVEAGKTHIWDVLTGQEKIPFIKESVGSVAFSPDGKLLVTTEIYAVRLWDVSTGQEKARLLHTESNYLYSVTFSPDEKLLATRENRTVHLWDVSTGQEKARLSYNQYVSYVTFSPDGKILAATEGGFVHLWDVPNGEEVARLLNTESYGNLTFSPDGRTLATGDGKAVRIWDVSTGLEIARMLFDNNVFRLGFGFDGNHLVASYNAGVTIWQLEKGWQRYNWEMVNAISSDRKTMLSASICPPKEMCHITIRIWDVITKKDVFHTSLLSGAVDNITFSPNSEFVALSDSNNIVYVWKTSTRQEVVRITSPVYITSMIFSPDGKLLVTGSYDNIVRVWDIQSGNLILSLQNSGNIFDFSPDGKLLGIGGFDTNIYVWNISDSYWSIAILNDVKIDKLIFSPDGKLLATNGINDKSVRVWNMSTAQEIVRLFQDETITTLAFDLSGKLLATGGYDKTVRIWDVSKGEEISRLLHDGPVIALAFNSDGKLLATGSQDKTARVWDLSSGQEIGRMLHDYEVSLVAFDPDEKMIISSSSTTRTWPWKINDLIDAVCGRMPRNFTRAEWAHYFPDEKYRATCPNLLPAPEPTSTPTVAPTATFVAFISTPTFAPTATYVITPISTPILISTDLSVSPFPSVENPMALIEEFAKQTLIAQNATAFAQPTQTATLAPATLFAQSAQTATALVQRNLSAQTATAFIQNCQTLATFPSTPTTPIATSNNPMEMIAEFAMQTSVAQTATVYSQICQPVVTPTLTITPAPTSIPLP